MEKRNGTGTIIIIKLRQEIENKLVQLAKRTGKRKSSYIKEIILKHLEDSLIAESAYMVTSQNYSVIIL